MRRRSRGFTLPELMATLATMGAFGAAITAVGMRVSEEQKVAAGREADLVGLRKAARLLESDVRAGLDPEASGWRLVRNVLWRGDEVVLRSAAWFHVRRQGEVWHIELAVKPRASDGPRHEAVLEWDVRARAAEASR